MPVSLSALRKDQRTLGVEYASETITLTYRPSAVTPAFVESVQSDAKQTALLVGAIGDLVASWDLVDDAGKELDPKSPLVRELPLAFLNNVLSAVLEDMQSPKASARG